MTVDCYFDYRHHPTYVHRAVASTFIRMLSVGDEVDHIDGNKGNNSVANLEIVTKAENMARASRNGLMSAGDRHYSRKAPERLARGEQAGGSKLTAEQVIHIRRRGDAGESFASIARAFGIAYQNVATIVRRTAWRHIDG